MNKQEIYDYLDELDVFDYIVNDDLTVDGRYNVNLYHMIMEDELPFNFNHVRGIFEIDSNDLTSLKGCPKIVGKGFYCNDNLLTTLENGPVEVNGGYNCENNKLTSLEGSPKCVGQDFVCFNNELTSLEHSPKNVGDNFYCEENYIYNLDKFDCVFKGKFICLDNPIGTLFNEVDYDFIQAFKSLKVVKDKELNLRRFKYLMFNIFDKKSDYEKIDFSEVEKYYKVK